METQQTQPAKVSLPESIVQAQKSKHLISGKVVAVDKTGFLVEIDGYRAHCLLNKMSDSFIHIKNTYIGKELNFVVEGTKGGAAQLSRIAALDIENAQLLDRMAKEWRQLDQVFDGQVIRTADFGAFIDIGGLEGLIPISELAWGHTEKVTDVLKTGDRVKVKIVRWESANGRHKVSFSMKVLLKNPWDSLDDKKYAQGLRLTGKVSRFIPQGAVIEFEPAIEGLLTPDEMSWDQTPVDLGTVLEKDAQVEVLINRVDRRKNQISLTRKFPEADPWKDLEERLVGKESHLAKVLTLNSTGANVQIEPGIEGFLPVRLLQKAFENAYRKKASPGAELQVTVKRIDRRSRELVLSLPQLATGDEDSIHFHEYEKARKKKTSTDGDEKLGSLGALLQARISGKK